MENKVIEAYKGYEWDMTCRGFRYEEGKEYAAEGSAMLCQNGFHASGYPCDAFIYYQPSSSIYGKVELSGGIEEEEPEDGNKWPSKACAEKIAVGQVLSYWQLPGEAARWLKGNAEEDTGARVALGDGSMVKTVKAWHHGSGGFNGTVVGGTRSLADAAAYENAMVGEGGVARGGNSSICVAEAYGMAESGTIGISVVRERGIALTDKHGMAMTGSGGLAISGRYGLSAAGHDARAICGNDGIALSRGMAECGMHGVAVAAGWRPIAKGDTGSLVTLVAIDVAHDRVAYHKALFIDDMKYFHQLWYGIVEGKLVSIEPGRDGNPKMDGKLRYTVLEKLERLA